MGKVSSKHYTVTTGYPHNPEELQKFQLTLPQRLENSYLKRYLHTDIHSSIVHSDQDMEATKVFYDRWLAKETVVHIYNRILFSHKKSRNTVICDNMDGPRDNQAKRNKPDRQSWKSHDITYM